MALSSLGIGVIGGGLIGFFHCYCLKSIMEKTSLPVKLCHVADRDPEKARKLQEGFGFDKYTSAPSEVFRDPAVNAVFICTWTSEHKELVRQAARSGKHVFCEKPLAFTEEEAREMDRFVTDAGVKNQVGLVLRQGPVWNVLRHEIEKRDTGRPQTLIFRDDQCFPVKGVHSSLWRKDKDKAGHGTLLEHSIHDLDLLEWIFGPITSVRAETRSTFGHEEIEDLARVDMEFDSGMTGVLVSVWHDVINRHSDRRLEVFYERDFLALESEYTGPLRVMEGEGELETISEEAVNAKHFDISGITSAMEKELSTMYGVYQDYLFCKNLLEDKAAFPGFKVAVRAHKLVDACFLSADRGERVKICKD